MADKIFQVKRGEIYNANLDPVKGSEQGGVRPVLVMNNNRDYRKSTTIIVLPISSRTNKKNFVKNHVRIKGIKGLPEDSIILTEQVRTIDKERLINYMGKIDKRSLIKAEKALIRALRLEPFLKGTERNVSV